MVTLEQLNLLEPWPGMGCADVIFMRNVLVYFDIATKRALLARLRGRLHRDGVLFLGGAETPVNIDDQLVADGAAGRSRFYRVRRPD